jgi:hypothetical protein
MFILCLFSCHIQKTNFTYTVDFSETDFCFSKLIRVSAHNHVTIYNIVFCSVQRSAATTCVCQFAMGGGAKTIAMYLDISDNFCAGLTSSKKLPTAYTVFPSLRDKYVQIRT